MTDFVGLSEHEALAVASMFDVDEAAVRRDHLVSLIVAELAGDARTDVALGARTALARVHLPAARLTPLSRLSGDVEVVTTDDPRAVAGRIGHVVVRALRPGHGRPTWSPAPGDTSGPAVLHTETGLTVRLLLTGVGRAWPAEHLDVEPRYGDVPQVGLPVLNLEACAAWTCLRWCVHGDAEDLYDLWTLARANATTASAARLFAEHGPTGGPPSAELFETPPSDERWRAALAGQARLRVSAAEAAHTVARAWRQAAAGDPHALAG